jgi:hypothetical protein
MAQDLVDSRLQLLQQQLLGFVALFQDTIEDVRAELRGAEPRPALQQQQDERTGNPYDHLQADIFQPRSLAGPWNSSGQPGGSGHGSRAALLLHGSMAPLQQQQDVPGQHVAQIPVQHQQQTAGDVGQELGSRLVLTAAAAAGTAEGVEVLLETQLAGGDGTDTALMETQVLNDGLTVDQPAAAAAAEETRTPNDQLKAAAVEGTAGAEQQQLHNQQLQHSNPVSSRKQRHGEALQHSQQHSQERAQRQQHVDVQSASQPELGATDSSDSRRMQQSPAASSSSSGTSTSASSSSRSDGGVAGSEHGMQADSAAAAAAAAAAGDASEEAGEVLVELAGDDDTHTGMLRMTYPGGRSAEGHGGSQQLRAGPSAGPVAICLLPGPDHMAVKPDKMDRAAVYLWFMYLLSIVSQKLFSENVRSCCLPVCLAEACVGSTLRCRQPAWDAHPGRVHQRRTCTGGGGWRPAAQHSHVSSSIAAAAALAAA